MSGPRFALSPGARLRHDPVRGKTLLLAAERGLVLSDTAAAVLRLCDGSRDTAAIARALGERYGADPEVIERDVRETLQALARARFVVPRDS